MIQMENLKRIAMSLMLLCACMILHAQDLKVSGTVISGEDNEPVIGATVREKGTQRATVTDLDGRFTLTVKQGAVIEISYLGMQTVEMPAAAKMNVTLTLDTRPAWVSADRQMMEELLYNLCDNAIRYNVRGGSVRVEARPVKEQVIVCVQDTGIGISKENQEHVFERFYRVDKSRSKATGGTGLGLAIVKHIVNTMNGMIEVHSKYGEGTEFLITLPRAPESEVGGKPEEEQEETEC